MELAISIIVIVLFILGWIAAGKGENKLSYTFSLAGVSIWLGHDITLHHWLFVVFWAIVGLFDIFAIWVND